MSMNHVYYNTFMWVKLWLMILCCLTQASGKDMSELENSMVTIIKVFHKYSGHNCKLKKAEFKALINNEMSHFIMVSLRIGSANINQHVCGSILQVTVQHEKDFCLVFTLRISSPQCTSVFFSLPKYHDCFYKECRTNWHRSPWFLDDLLYTAKCLWLLQSQS